VDDVDDVDWKAPLSTKSTESTESTLPPATTWQAPSRSYAFQLADYP